MILLYLLIVGKRWPEVLKSPTGMSPTQSALCILALIMYTWMPTSQAIVSRKLVGDLWPENRERVIICVKFDTELHYYIIFLFYSEKNNNNYWTCDEKQIRTNKWLWSRVQNTSVFLHHFLSISYDLKRLISQNNKEC